MRVYKIELLSQNWLEVYDSNTPTVVASTIREKLRAPLGKMAPMKLRNIKANRSHKLGSSRKCIVEKFDRDNT